MATEVGKRRDGKPVMLMIEAGRAWREGVAFYRGNEKVWLVDAVPEAHIRVAEG